MRQASKSLLVRIINLKKTNITSVLYDEVRCGFINFVVPFYTPMKNNDQGFYIGKFIEELEKDDYEAFLTWLETFFADIPYELSDQTERHYQVIFYLVFKLMGQFTEAEVRNSSLPLPQANSPI